jgi:hypothetical protein
MPLLRAKELMNWMKATLTVAADELFEPRFYPCANHLGNRNVYFKLVEVGGRCKVIVNPFLDHGRNIKVFTEELAMSCLDPHSQPISAVENAALELHLEDAKLKL